MSYYESIMNALKAKVEEVTDLPVYIQNKANGALVEKPCVILCINDLVERDVERTFEHDLIAYPVLLLIFYRESQRASLDYDFLDERETIANHLDSQTVIISKAYNVDVTFLRIAENTTADDARFLKEEGSIAILKAKERYQDLQSAMLVNVFVADPRPHN